MSILPKVRGKKPKKPRGTPLRDPRGQFERPTGRQLSIEVFDRTKDALYPRVHISSTAHGKMRALIAAAQPNEVTWLPAIDILADGSVSVYDIFVPGQECGRGITNVTSSGESELYSELMATGQTQTIKKLLGWGHSHVWFDVYASGVDEVTTQQYLTSFYERGKTHFVRLIGNYFDDMFASIYLVQQGVVIHHPLICAEPTRVEDYTDWAVQQVLEKVSVARPQPTVVPSILQCVGIGIPRYPGEDLGTEGAQRDTFAAPPNGRNIHD